MLRPLQCGGARTDLRWGLGIEVGQQRVQTRWRGVLVFAFFASLLIDRFSVETAVDGAVGAKRWPPDSASLPPTYPPPAPRSFKTNA